MDEISLKGAKGVLINITGGDDLTLFELDEAANRIREEVDADANIIVGSTMDPGMSGRMRVSVVATGIDAAVGVERTHERRSMAEPLAQPVHMPAEEIAPAAPAAPAYEEPSLFEAPQPAPVASDGLPPPAYQPEPQPQQGAAVATSRPAGTPSPEALARLERATGRAPGSMAQHTPGEAAYSRSRPALPEVEQERPRFGINTLINRMSGAAPGAQETGRQQPPVSRAAEPYSEMSEDQERIEIPAFLRRQAN